jgi:hypothetical protein
MLPCRMVDPVLRDPTYKYYDWVNIGATPFFPPYICSRVHQVNTPWHLAPSLLPLPDLKRVYKEVDFSIVMDSIAAKFCNLVSASDRTPYIRWSGGVDSTSIIVSLLRVASPAVLDRIIILCDKKSIDENPYFYYKFINGKLAVEDDTAFKIDSTNYNKIFLVDGDCAEMIAGSTVAYSLVRREQSDMLDKPWRSVPNLNEVLWPENPNRANFAIDLIKESIKYSPLEIRTVYDFFWWHYFNYKINDSLMRSASYYTQHLTPAESKEFFETSLHRFFVYQEMQIWSMITMQQRGEKNLLDSKYYFKKYIYDFDRNDFYFYNTHKHRSMPDCWFRQFNVESLFAIDSDWNRYSVATPEHRHQLGQILERI